MGVTFLVWVLSVLPIHGAKFSDLSTSVIGHLGHWIEPVLRPLGFNWKIGIGLLSSIVAREVIVGTLGTLYGVDAATHSLGLQVALRHDVAGWGDCAGGVFCLRDAVYIDADRGAAGAHSWKLPALQFAYMTTVAYVAALVANQVISRLFSAL